jgi:hypothetical protein
MGTRIVYEITPERIEEIREEFRKMRRERLEEWFGDHDPEDSFDASDRR